MFRVGYFLLQPYLPDSLGARVQYLHLHGGHKINKDESDRRRTFLPEETVYGAPWDGGSPAFAV
jgi:hypothetical protein